MISCKYQPVVTQDVPVHCQHTFSYSHGDAWELQHRPWGFLVRLWTLFNQPAWEACALEQNKLKPGSALQLLSCKARTMPSKNQQPRRSQHCWQLSNQDPQIPTHCFCSPSLLSSPLCFQMGFPSKATSGKLSSICSQASLPAANSFTDQLISLDYLNRGFLAFLSLPTAIMCIYKTIMKKIYI